MNLNDAGTLAKEHLCSLVAALAHAPTGAGGAGEARPEARPLAVDDGETLCSAHARAAEKMEMSL